MSLYLYLIFLGVSFGASVVGAICGIGGGVLIKPILDAFGVLSVASISFLSGCTVLSMSCYSVLKARLSKESLVDLKTGTPLAIGAAIGGVTGKMMFQYLSDMFTNKDQVGAIQAVCLLIITLGTMIYTLKKIRLRRCTFKIRWCASRSALFWESVPPSWELAEAPSIWWYCFISSLWILRQQRRTPCILFCSPRLPVW